MTRLSTLAALCPIVPVVAVGTITATMMRSGTMHAARIKPFAPIHLFLPNAERNSQLRAVVNVQMTPALLNSIGRFVLQYAPITLSGS